MKLHDPTFLSFAGEPITGRAPPQLLVYGNDGVLTGGQYGAVTHAYKLFRDALLVSVDQNYLVQNRILEDGTRVRMVSTSGRDQVFVWPPPTGGSKFALLPAFYYNAPALGESNPTDVNSATWLNMPYADGTTPKTQEHFWKVHPGNRTWRDGRTDSKYKGLVLSWWSFSRDRYGADWNSPTTAASVPPDGTYGKVYCNGHLIADFSPSAVYGACITEVDSKPFICVVTASWNGWLSFGGNTHRYGTGTAASDSFFRSLLSTGDLTLLFRHAPLPAKFMHGREFSKPTFTAIAEIALKKYGTPIPHGGADYNIWLDHDHDYSGTHGISFNSSGTEGVIPFFGRLYGWPDSGTGTIPVRAVLVNPATGVPSDCLIDFTLNGSGDPDPAGYFASFYGGTWSTGTQWPSIAYDYQITDGVEELVWTGVRKAVQSDYVSGEPPGATAHFFYHSKYGVLKHGDSNDALSPMNYDWMMTGDLRVGLTHWVGMLNWRGTGDGAGEPAVVIYTFLKGTLLNTQSTTEATGTNSYTMMSVGFEGTESSFDNRLIVDVCNGVVRLYVDGVDQSSQLDSADQAIRYPVLCGPIALAQGRFQTSPKQYVKGTPP